MKRKSSCMEEQEDDVPKAKNKSKQSKPGKSSETHHPVKVKAEASDDVSNVIIIRSPKKKSVEVDEGEKRLRRYRPKAPQSFLDIKARALTQRFFVIDRYRTGSAEEPSEQLEVAGTTGNIYTINIEKVPRCDCPHARAGNQCKHIIYVMMRILKAPEELAYQLALTTSELKGIFAAAPPLPSEVGKSEVEAGDTNRKPLDDDCPICYDCFNPTDEAVWCQDGCGNNVHKACFQKWANSSRASSGKVTCPFCRAQWKQDELQINKDAGTVGFDGYRNVAAELGLSGQRDYSSYNQYWVRRQRRNGYIHDEDINGYQYYDRDEDFERYGHYYE